jgi:hypothetical protein
MLTFYVFLLLLLFWYLWESPKVDEYNMDLSIHGVNIPFSFP